MGILDSKTRILDTIVTLEGRRQISTGRLKIDWISVSDTATFYEADLISGSSDATRRLYLEACHLPQDQVTFEADDSGRLMPFKNDKGLVVKSGKIFSSSVNITGSFSNDVVLIENDQFASLASTLLSSSLDNFKKLQMVGTIDPVFEDSEFLAGPTDMEFIITDELPIEDVRMQTSNINHMESFFEDRRLSHIDNFMFLPPIIKIDDPAVDPTSLDDTKKYRIGLYTALGPTRKLEYSDFEEELLVAERTGFCKTVRFDPTSRNNRIVSQFFEIRKNDILKLDVIDFGSYSTDDPDHPRKKMYFVGKIMKDDDDNFTFVHLFTLVFD